MLENGHWLIAWGPTRDRTVPVPEVVAVTEVDTAGNAVFHMNMNLSSRELQHSYRAYHDSEDNVSIPLTYP